MKFWTRRPAPSPAGAFLSGVACTSSAACTAVGGSNAGTLAERWNGTTWSTQATANPPQGGGALFWVVCASPSACTAVGTSNAGNLAERWRGTSRSIQPTPNPADAQFTYLNTVACSSALVEQWNRTGTSTQAATGRPVVPGALTPACMTGSLPISARIPAAARSRFRAGSFLSRAGTRSPASRTRCGAG